MSDKANVIETPPFEVTNKIAQLLLVHFFDSKIKVQEYAIKIWVEQMCTQDFIFLNRLYENCNQGIAINVKKSGSGVSIILGVAKIFEVPEYLINYKIIQDI